MIIDLQEYRQRRKTNQIITSFFNMIAAMINFYHRYVIKPAVAAYVMARRGRVVMV